jgi:hypothetical protein
MGRSTRAEPPRPGRARSRGWRPLTPSASRCALITASLGPQPARPGQRHPRRRVDQETRRRRRLGGGRHVGGARAVGRELDDQRLAGARADGVEQARDLARVRAERESGLDVRAGHVARARRPRRARRPSRPAATSSCVWPSRSIRHRQLGELEGPRRGSRQGPCWAARSSSSARPASSYSRGGGLPWRGSTVTVLHVGGEREALQQRVAERAARHVTSNVPDALMTGPRGRGTCSQRRRLSTGPSTHRRT